MKLSTLLLIFIFAPMVCSLVVGIVYAVFAGVGAGAQVMKEKTCHKNPA